MRLLVAEDEYYARKALIASVRDWDRDVRIDEAENGLYALEMLRASSYDLLLLDIKMPLLDGLSLSQQLCAEGISVYTIIISGFSEFDFARQAMKAGVKDYLLKPVDTDKLCEALETACDELNRKSLRPSEREMENWLESGGCPPRNVRAGETCFAVYAAGEHLSGAFSALQSEERAVLPCGKTSALVIETRAEKQLPEVVTESCGDPAVRYFVSERFAFSGASDAMRQARALYNVRALTSDHVTNSGFLEKRTEYINILNEEGFRILGDLLNECRIKEAQAAVTDLSERFLDHARLSPYCVQDALNHLCALMNTLSARPMLTAGARLSLEDFDDRASLETALRGTINAVCELQDEKPSHRKRIVDDIRAIIDEHYSENISLKTLASTRMFLNVSYLSRLFKAETGRSFRTYLTDVRLEKAREQIRLRDESITHIAMRCGYTDVSHFIQLFRERFGITPNAYREECQKERDKKVN